MTIETASTSSFFVVRWGRPEPADFERIIREVTSLRDAAGVDILYLGIMPEDMPKLEQDDNKRLMKLTQDLLPLCKMVCVAMEMRGFRGAIIRSTMTAVTLVTRRHDKLRFVDTVEAALEASKPHHPATPGEIGRAIETAGGTAPPGYA